MTFKEVANFILSQPEEIQNAEAVFGNIDEGESVTINGENIKSVVVVERGFAPAIFGAPMAYRAIVTSDEEINDEYDF